MTTLLKVENLTKAFGEKVILNSLNFDVHAGEIFGVIGLSGSGKTTLLNTLVGFHLPEDGDVFLKTQNHNFSNLSDRHNDIKNYIGMAPQQSSFYPKLTVKENLQHYAALHGLSNNVIENNIDYLITLVGLEDSMDKLAKDLSGGMQKRLGIACALVHRPKILFLDEPTADLDPVTRKQMWQLIKRINGLGTTIIMASHFLSELEALCSRIAVLSQNRIQEIGTSAELKQKHSNQQKIYFETSSGKYDDLISELNRLRLPINNVDIMGHKACIDTDNSEKVLEALLRIVKSSSDNLLEVEVNKTSLGEVFEALVK